MHQKQHDTLIIIPVFNEENNIEWVIDDLYINYRNADIVVINDGSTDNTLNILKKRQIPIINHEFNMGIGASFQTGCLFALENEYDYIIRIDGDGQHNAKFINRVFTPVKNNEVDITVGSRFLDKAGFATSFSRLLGILTLSYLLTVITGKKITDPTSGFCAMNKKAYEFFSKACAEDYPEPEIVLYHRSFTIKEIPITMAKRQNGTSSITPLKSVYYMYKVLLSLFMSVFRREAT